MINYALGSNPLSRAALGSCAIVLQPVRETVSYRGLFTAGWFGVREKHCSRLEIYDRLRASEQAAGQAPYRVLINFSCWTWSGGVHFTSETYVQTNGDNFLKIIMAKT